MISRAPAKSEVFSHTGERGSFFLQKALYNTVHLICLWELQNVIFGGNACKFFLLDSSLIVDNLHVKALFPAESWRQ